jgi:drug/metabolite transporter (DMT)-like permease
MAVVLALLSAAAYGTADYIGGVIAGRASAWQVAVVVMVSATLASLPVALLVGGDPVLSDWLLSFGGGAAAGTGTAFLYRGLARGRMTVVATLSGVVAAIIPVIIGLVQGDRPSSLALVGIACALPAIVLVAGGGGEDETASGDEPTESARGAIADGLIAGTGFGLLFAATGSLSDDAGLLAVPALEIGGVLGIIAVAALLGHDWWPRERAAWGAWSSGVLGFAAVALVTLASREGLLAVVAVIASLYPAFTVLLAAVFLGERIARLQGVGLALAAAAVVLVAAG